MRKDNASDHFLAAIFVLAAHCALGWLLLTQAPLEPRGGTDTALRIHWIEPPPPAAVPEPRADPRSETPPPPPAAAPAAPVTRAMTVVDLPSSPPPQADSPARLPARSLLEQGRSWADAQAGTHDFRRDPLRPPGAPERAAERFRMTPPPSPAQVLEIITPRGYEADPCPRIRRNLAGMAPGGDGELLQEEIRRSRRLCR